MRFIDGKFLILIFFIIPVIKSAKFNHNLCIYDKLRYDKNRGVYFIFTNPKIKEKLDIPMTQKGFEDGVFMVTDYKCSFQKYWLPEVFRFWIVCCK